MNPGSPLDIDQAVNQRYSAASNQQEPALCCPVNYEARYLEVLPAELIERDYGCGDPSRYVQAGETVLDLGSGGGKICYIAAQIVGPDGAVIGVDINDEMLALARKYQQQISEQIGHDNVRFLKGRIQDLATDLAAVEERLRQNPPADANAWLAINQEIRQQSRQQPMIPDQSVDVVLSNCVLNLVDPADRIQMIREIHRVLKPGGRVVISDIVSDEPVPQELKNDPELWSGCISGAFVEHEFIEVFENHGFYGVEIVDRQSAPWRTVDGIEFRSMTLRAYKLTPAPCLDYGHAIIYNGPWKAVIDDEDHVLTRGERVAVCKANFERYTSGPYASHVTPLPPAVERSDAEAQPFDCRSGELRDPRETKRGAVTVQAANHGRAATNGLPISDCGSGSEGCC